jgi:hypothetical protein
MLTASSIFKARYIKCKPVQGNLVVLGSHYRVLINTANRYPAKISVVYYTKVSIISYPNTNTL